VAAFPLSPQLRLRLRPPGPGRRSRHFPVPGHRRLLRPLPPALFTGGGHGLV